MNLLDLGVIGIIGLSAVFAFARGFVREALSIVAWVGAAAVTLYCFNWAYVQVESHIHNPLLSQVVAGFSLFVVCLIVFTILTSMVARLVHFSGLTPIDRTLGFIFGLARGTFILCLAFLLLDVSVQQNDRPQWIREAKSAPYLHEGADMLRGFMPESLKLKSSEALDDAMKSLNPAAEAQKAMRALSQPTPASPAAKPDAPKAEAPKAEAPLPPAQTPAYKPGDQKQLDRLIGTQR